MHTQQKTNDFDVIVVGSGPAGATVARELSRQRKKVLILERGGDGPLSEGLGMASIARNVAVNDDLKAVRAITTGGTTALYFGVAETPPLDAFQALGIDLRRALEEAQRELPLTVLPDEMLGEQALRVREATIALGHVWKKSTMLVDTSKCAGGYAYDAKWNARILLRAAVADGATLLPHARAMKVLADGNRAIGVEYQSGTKEKNFEMRRAYGAKIVLAAGGATEVGDGNPARVFYRLFMLNHRRWFRAFLHSKSIGVGVMVKEPLGGELRDDGRYYKQFKQEDLKKLDKGEEVARDIIRRAGGKNIFKSALSAAHIGGSVRIKETIDENLETEYRNLHVCDGSVIPDDVHVAPTLTLVCLGKYLANYLAQRL